VGCGPRARLHRDGVVGEGRGGGEGIDGLARLVDLDEGALEGAGEAERRHVVVARRKGGGVADGEAGARE
jgi:hypothetical protein